MVEIFGPGVRAASTKEFEKILKVPQVLLNTNTDTCKVVQISYVLKIEADIPGCHGNISFLIPITIGSVPLDISTTTIPHATAPLHLTDAQSETLPLNGSFPNAPTAPFSIEPSEIRKFLKRVSSKIKFNLFSFQLRQHSTRQSRWKLTKQMHQIKTNLNLDSVGTFQLHKRPRHQLILKS